MRIRKRVRQSTHLKSEELHRLNHPAFPSSLIPSPLGVRGSETALTRVCTRRETGCSVHADDGAVSTDCATEGKPPRRLQLLRRELPSPDTGGQRLLLHTKYNSEWLAETLLSFTAGTCSCVWGAELNKHEPETDGNVGAAFIQGN